MSGIKGGAAGARRRKYWGWGYESEGIDAPERERIRNLLKQFFSIDADEPPAVIPPSQLQLSRPRIPLPETSQCAVANAPFERALHAAGRSYVDVFKLRHGLVEAAPDVVARPTDSNELAAILEWADRQQASVIPYGGGTSVTGGVTPQRGTSHEGVVTVDLQRMNAVVDIDDVSRTVGAQAGILGPDLEAALRPSGLTMRHYPQSYYFSTLGGWIATRSAGHYSTLFGRIDDRVVALEIMLPDGRLVRTPTYPASSVGPDPNRLWIGSEGTLGIITKAWVRTRAIPSSREVVSVEFPSFARGLEAARAIVQADLYPAHLRVLDPYELLVSSAFAGDLQAADGALMVLGFEASGYDVTGQLEQAIGIAENHGGDLQASGDGRDSEGEPDEQWKKLFFRQPYLRDVLVEWGLVVDTFETAISWSTAREFYEDVRMVTLEAVMSEAEVGAVLCRTTHAYEDGVAFYFTFIAQPRENRQLECWEAIKRAASDRIVDLGGTVSHHHACGRDHVPWASRELPEIWFDVLRSTKAELDPDGRLNPGVLFSERNRGDG